MVKAKRKDALDSLKKEYLRPNPPKRKAMLEEAYCRIEAAQIIYDMRASAGLTQRELAKLVGTSASAICRLEDADYSGHTLTMLNRIATALGKRIVIRAVPKNGACRFVQVHWARQRADLGAGELNGPIPGPFREATLTPANDLSSRGEAVEVGGVVVAHFAEQTQRRSDPL